MEDLQKKIIRGGGEANQCHLLEDIIKVKRNDNNFTLLMHFGKRNRKFSFLE